MDYSSVISLETAKTYLGIDDTARDAEISRMVNSACAYIEKYTNVLLVDRDVTYYFNDNNCVLVYDFPVNSLVSPNTATRTRKSTYFIYTDSTADTDELVLSVGYSDPADISSDLIDAALEMVSVWFYSSEKREATSLIPLSIKQVLDLHKRFLI